MPAGGSRTTEDPTIESRGSIAASTTHSSLTNAGTNNGAENLSAWAHFFWRSSLHHVSALTILHVKSSQKGAGNSISCSVKGWSIQEIRTRISCGKNRITNSPNDFPEIVCINHPRFQVYGVGLGLPQLESTKMGASDYPQLSIPSPNWSDFPTLNNNMTYEPPSKSIVGAWYENIGCIYLYIAHLGALSLYSVLFKSTLNNAKMQRNWLHGFRSLNCWEWIKGRSLSLRLQPYWGAL